MDCLDGNLISLMTRWIVCYDTIHKVDENGGQLEMQIDINQAIVINKIGVIGDKLGSIIYDETQFNVTVEQKMQGLYQNTKTYDLALQLFKEVSDRSCEQIQQIHKMIDARNADIWRDFDSGMKSQFDKLNNKIDEASETLADNFNCEIDNV